jgi:hypothetical protein
MVPAGDGVLDRRGRGFTDRESAYPTDRLPGRHTPQAPSPRQTTRVYGRGDHMGSTSSAALLLKSTVEPPVVVV